MSFKRIIVTVVIIIIITIAVVRIGVFVSGQSLKKMIQRAPELSTVVKQVVSSYLKSPGSAQFAELIIKEDVTKENRYLVLGDVDSQNGFGALLRTHFFLEIIDKGGDKQSIDNWTTDRLVLDNVGLILNGKPYDTPLPFDEGLITLQKQLEDSIRGQK